VQKHILQLTSSDLNSIKNMGILEIRPEPSLQELEKIVETFKASKPKATAPKPIQFIHPNYESSALDSNSSSDSEADNPSTFPKKARRSSSTLTIKASILASLQSQRISY
jgi:hypothetical protein